MKIHPSAKIAKTAVIKEGAIIGENVEIGDFCVIGENVEIGDFCVIYDRVTITGFTKLGRNNKVFTGAAVGVPPQDLKFAGERSELIIGDDNLIREFTTLNPGTEGGGGQTLIGNKNLMMAYAHVAHDCKIGNHCILANNATLGGHVEIGDHVNIGGLSPVHQFCKIGDGVMLAGGSVLTQDAPPYCMLEGNRAVIRGLNRHRMRKIFDSNDIDEISLLYRRLFSRKAPLKEIAQEELEKSQNPVLLQICRFILDSARGIPLNTRKQN